MKVLLLLVARILSPMPLTQVIALSPTSYPLPPPTVTILLPWLCPPCQSLDPSLALLSMHAFVILFPTFILKLNGFAISITLYDTPNIMPTQCSLMVSSQPPPFPFLCIDSSSNTATFLHGITVFHPPLGFSITTHPLAGAILALAGEILDQGAPP